MFWTSCPSVWFAQIEAQFSIRNITADDTKYYYVVSAFDFATATRAQSLLVSPPTENKYQAIKEFLISAFDLSEYERASSLFAMTGLGDSKPSELMDSMLALMGSHKPCFLFRHLFLQQLPTHIRAPIAQSKIEDYRARLQTTQPTSGGAVTRTQAAVQIVSNLPAPRNGGTIYRFLGMPAMRTRWMAGAVAHKSG